MNQRPIFSVSMPSARTAIFIDGAHFEFVRKGARERWGLSDEINWRSVLQELTQNTILLRAYYYAGEWTDQSILDYLDHQRRKGVPEEQIVEEEEGMRQLQAGQANFRRYLSRNGFMVRTKPVKTFSPTKIKADMDLVLAIDMLTLADRCDRFVLVSGDSDFVPLVETVGQKGVRVIVVATQQLPNPRAADELVDAADEFVELKDIWDRLERRRPRQNNYSSI